MEKFVSGDIVVLPFPFSDLSYSKKRPALVLTNLNGDDVILCQITSNLRADKYSITLSNHDFKNGSLPHLSSIKPHRIFTADTSIILYKKGTLKHSKYFLVQEKLRQIFSL